MFARHIASPLLAVAVAAAVLWLPAGAGAVNSIYEETAADRAVVTRAMEQYTAALTEAEAVDARAREVAAALDAAVTEELRCERRLGVRVVSMYRSGDNGVLSLLLGAADINDLTERWELLDRLARQDAQDLKALRLARAEAGKAAEELLVLQAEHAKALDALAAEVRVAKGELAESETALRAYEAEVAAAAAAAAKRATPKQTSADPNQQLAGTGEWGTAVASHYGRNFSGKGASGESIGPYSMIVAHRTLAFGTLIEFEYNGKRAVARVSDRGPHIAGREFDLGPGVVRVLDFNGVHQVRYRIVTR